MPKALSPYIQPTELREREYRQPFPPGYVPRDEAFFVLTAQAPLPRRVIPALVKDLSPERAAAAAENRKAKIAHDFRMASRLKHAGSRISKVIARMRQTPDEWHLGRELGEPFGETSSWVTSSFRLYVKRGEIAVRIDEKGRKLYRWVG